MSIKQSVLAFAFFAVTGITEGQKFATVSGDLLTLDNGVVKRIIQVGSDNQGIISKSYSLIKTGNEFLSAGSADFYFEADGKPFTGLDNWKPVNVKIIDGENRRNGALIELENPASVYEVKKAPSGEFIMNSTGKELAERGFSVNLDKKYDGSVYEISKKVNK